MMLQKIQNALININETIFQELCDCYFYTKNGCCGTINRIGSQVGKQKTKKGTPDSYISLPNGKYILLEYSTNVTQGVDKLLSDVVKCLDCSKTGIPINNIEKIVLFFNFNLKPSEEQKLYNFASENRVILELYNLDTLSLELKLNFRNLTHEYLGLPIDTGQIVSIDKFIDEYDKASKGIATPLDNTFIHRDKELAELEDFIRKNDLVILYGAPGVGKTKLALETIKKIVKDDISYKAYCVSYKNTSLIEDLQQYMHLDNNYILFVDDANRIDNIGQIIGFYKTDRKGKLKIIITVRDYAYSTIEKICGTFLHISYTIKAFTDEQIVDIVKAEPFGILNTLYHKEITRIANGNPRIAIMVAKLAIEKQDIYALYDVSDLFEKYFSTFVEDNGEFDKSINIKILGIIAFFYTVPYKNKEVIIPILNFFEIAYDDFIEQIDILEKLELLEIQYEYVKISEQNLSTYFFYKSFVNEKLLSFDTLLNGYFFNYKYRFNDCIVQTCNTFGYKNVCNSIKSSLVKYYEAILNNTDFVLDFLSVFYGFIPNETVQFVFDIVENMPDNNTLCYHYENNDTNNNQLKNDNILDLLRNFYISPNENFMNSLELSFEYVRKKPELLTELLNSIKTVLAINTNDEHSGYVRQINLYRLLIGKAGAGDLLFIKSFYVLSQLFLSFRFEHAEFGRNNAFTIRYHTIKHNNTIYEFRKNIWECICSNFCEDALLLLENYMKSSLEIVKEIIENDVPFICFIINKHFTPDNFIHCKLVQQYVRWCKINKITHQLLESLPKRFTNSTYEMFLIINWDIYRDKDIYMFDDYKHYAELKETEIRKTFVFKNEGEIDSFYKDFIYITNIELKKNGDVNNYDKTLDIVVDETFKNSFDLGIYLLRLIINNGRTKCVLNKVFVEQLATQESADRIWSIIQNERCYANVELWEMSFYEYLPEYLICDKYKIALRNTVSNWNSKRYINLYYLKKFIDASPNLLEELLEVIVSKIETGDEVYISVCYLKDICYKLIENNIKLFEKVYIQQIKLQYHYDNKNEILQYLLTKDIDFLIEYIKTLYLDSDKYNHCCDDLSMVWEVENIEIVLGRLFDMVSEYYNHICSSEHFCNLFFVNLTKDVKVRAEKFLKRYCEDNYKDYRKVNIIVDIVRNRMKDLYAHFLLLYVSLTQDVNLFSNIKWCSTGGVYGGDVIIVDIHAAEWNNVLSIVNQSKIGYKLLPIKQYINSKVDSYLRTAEWERKRNFLR